MEICINHGPVRARPTGDKGQDGQRQTARGSTTGHDVPCDDASGPHGTAHHRSKGRATWTHVNSQNTCSGSREVMGPCLPHQGRQDRGVINQVETKSSTAFFPITTDGAQNFHVLKPARSHSILHIR